MRYVDAPPAGWYPDPQSRTSLRWWDGFDWSDIRRAPPSSAELTRAEASMVPLPVPGQQPLGQPQAGGYNRQDAQAIIDEVRTVARQELDRAANDFSARATTAVRSFTPLVTEYTSKLVRYVKLALGLATFLFIAWLLFQAIASQSFFDWLGDRIDNLTDENGLAATLLRLE